MDSNGLKGPASEPPLEPDARARRPRHVSEVHPGRRREWTLTLEEVAHVLRTDVRTVRKLIKIQRAEDEAAALEERPARSVGLRALYVSERVTRVTEQALGAYLNPHGRFAP